MRTMEDCLSSAEMNRVQKIISEYQNQRWGLIPLLQKVQEELGYIHGETLEPIADALQLSPSQVQGVVTFCAKFSLAPRGKYVIRVCRGKACHVREGRSILRVVKRELGVEEGETTPDFKYTLETVACLGACFLAPTMMVNRNYFGRLSPPKIRSILGQHQ